MFEDAAQGEMQGDPGLRKITPEMMHEKSTEEGGIKR